MVALSHKMRASPIIRPVRHVCQKPQRDCLHGRDEEHLPSPGKQPEKPRRDQTARIIGLSRSLSDVPQPRPKRRSVGETKRNVQTRLRRHAVEFNPQRVFDGVSCRPLPTAEVQHDCCADSHFKRAFSNLLEETNCWEHCPSYQQCLLPE